MKRVSATDAARRFSDLLDAVENRRESFVVVRRGREVATISPAEPATGRRLKELFEKHQPDPDWADEVRALRGALPDQPPAWTD